MGIMDVKGGRASNPSLQLTEEETMDLRRGPWTVEEDITLINYITKHGEGRWNSLARCAGLKRTGKSCRLRWLNYLRPDVKRGNITLEEQLLILELHSRWGNRWSKIAQHLPGRTDNEIKNYWRTRVQKHAKQLKCDVNSKQFKDTMRYLWMPRLVERIQAAAAAAASSTAAAGVTAPPPHLTTSHAVVPPHLIANYTPENSSNAASSDSVGNQVSPVSDLTELYIIPGSDNPNPDCFRAGQIGYGDSMASPSGFFVDHGLDIPAMEQNNHWLDGGDTSDNLWNVEDSFFLQHHLNDGM